MPVEGYQYGDRVWFHDERGTVRRMGISVHPEDSTIVISLWQGDACTGTFRMPAEDAARLISTLAYGMTEALPNGGSGSQWAPSGLREQWSQLLRRVLRRHPNVTKGHLRLLK
jgi:hypothetical protein